MRNLSTTVAVYPDVPTATLDWVDVEAAADAHTIDLADAALVRRTEDGSVERLERQSHHGWGKGAVAGAVVGLLFPPSLLGGAIVGGAGGGVLARMNRSLDRGDIKDLGDVMDSGEVALVVVTAGDSTDALGGVLTRATASTTKSGADADEVRSAIDEATPQPTT